MGVLNVPKILLARGPLRLQSPFGPARQFAFAFELVPPTLLRFVLVPFFVFHYGIFWAVHGVFVLSLPDIARSIGGSAEFGAIAPQAVIWGALAFGVGHLVSLRVNYIGRREYERVSAIDQMFRPYRRVLVLHVTILVGAFLISVVGTPLVLVVVMIVAKTILDVRYHLDERRIAPAAGETLLSGD